LSFFLKGQAKEIEVDAKEEMGVGNDDFKVYITKTK